MTSLRSRLVPYFTITHASRGQLPGPYTRLPTASPIRRLALDVVVTLAMSSAGDESLSQAVSIATAGTEEAGYWQHLRSAVA